LAFASYRFNEYFDCYWWDIYG